jgi:hypothetical protein
VEIKIKASLSLKREKKNEKTLFLYIAAYQQLGGLGSH